MVEPVRKLLHGAPRLLGIALALFVSVFALDVFGEKQGLAPTALALLMHLIPSGIVLAALAVSWRRPRVGAMLFTALGILYVASGWGRLHWSAFALIGGPLFLAGTLFLLDWRCGADRRTEP